MLSHGVHSSAIERGNGGSSQRLERRTSETTEVERVLVLQGVVRQLSIEESSPGSLPSLFNGIIGTWAMYEELVTARV